MTSPFVGGGGFSKGDKGKPESNFKKSNPDSVPHCIGSTDCKRVVVRNGMCSRHLVLEGMSNE